MTEYPLEQLATIKKKKLEEAERVLKEKRLALAKEEEKLVKVQEERDKVKKHRFDKLTQLREALDAGSPAEKIQQMKAYLKVVDEQLKQKEAKVREQQKNVDAAQKAVDAALADLFKKQKDVEKLDIHREEWQKEEKREEVRKEAIETDEMGAGMHTRRKKRSH